MAKKHKKTLKCQLLNTKFTNASDDCSGNYNIHSDCLRVGYHG